MYADGELVVSRMSNPEAGRELLGSGLFFHDARYNAVGACRDTTSGSRSRA